MRVVYVNLPKEFTKRKYLMLLQTQSKPAILFIFIIQYKFESTFKINFKRDIIQYQMLLKHLNVSLKCEKVTAFNVRKRKYNLTWFTFPID